MSLIKIDNVYLYTSGTNNTQDEIYVRNLLKGANISFTELAYNDPTQIPAVLSALSTWYWDEDKHQRVFTHFPIVTWKEYYTDLYPMDFNTVDVDELENSTLLENSGVVVKN